MALGVIWLNWPLVLYSVGLHVRKGRSSSFCLHRNIPSLRAAYVALQTCTFADVQHRRPPQTHPLAAQVSLPQHARGTTAVHSAAAARERVC